jgi:hypothetical protein
LVKAWRESGLKQRAYAKKVGIRPQRLSYWINRVDKPAVAAKHHFPVAMPSAPSFIQIEMPGRQAPSDGGLDISLANGASIRVYAHTDRDLLQRVMAALADTTTMADPTRGSVAC